MIQPSLTLTLDRERKLRLDFNALSKFEQVTGRSGFDPSTWAMPRALDIAAMVWALQAAAAEANHLLAGKMPPDDLDVLTFGQVRAILDPSRLVEVQQVLSTVWRLFFPEAEIDRSAPAAEDGADASRPPIG